MLLASYVFRLAVGKADVSVKLTSCSTPEAQQPVLAIAVVTPGLHISNVENSRLAGALCTKIRGRIYIKSDHSHTKCRLVIVQLLPLCRREGAPPAGGVFVSKFAHDDNTAIVPVHGRGTKRWQCDSSLWDKDELERNAIAIETRRRRASGSSIWGKHEDCARHRDC